MAIYLHANLAVNAVKGRLLLVAVLLSIYCIHFDDAQAATKNSSEPNIVIIAEPNVVKGFPMIVKVKARGPQAVPKLSIFSENAQIMVFLASKTEDEKYTISLTMGKTIDMAIPREGMVSDGTRLFRVWLPANVKRTMIFDLYSLSPEAYHKSTVLNDIPPGKYEIKVRFPQSGITSNSIPMHILAPSDEEKKFLQKMAGLSGHNFKLGTGVNWCSFLRSGLEFPVDDLNKSSEVAQRQLQFHILLSSVIAPESPAKNINIEPLKSIAVPEYLEPEKKFLFIEMEKVSGKDVAEKADALLQKNPGLKWRLEMINAPDLNLLGPRRYLEWRRKARDNIAK